MGLKRMQQEINNLPNDQIAGNWLLYTLFTEDKASRQMKHFTARSQCLKEDFYCDLWWKHSPLLDHIYNSVLITLGSCRAFIGPDYEHFAPFLPLIFKGKSTAVQWKLNKCMEERKHGKRCYDVLKSCGRKLKHDVRTMSIFPISCDFMKELGKFRIKLRFRTILNRW